MLKAECSLQCLMGDGAVEAILCSKQDLNAKPERNFQNT